MSNLFLILAGVMGAGKSVFVQSEAMNKLLDILPADFPNGIRILNVDARAATSSNLEAIGMPQRSAWISAAQDVEHIVDWHVSARSHIGVETVLSSDKYRPKLVRAQANSMKIVSIYLTVQSVDTLKQRVLDREKAGGHGADFTRFDTDWEKSHENVAWLWIHSDYFVAFDVTDSASKPKTIAVKYAGSSPFINENSKCRICIETIKNAQSHYDRNRITYVISKI